MTTASQTCFFYKSIKNLYIPQKATTIYFVKNYKFDKLHIGEKNMKKQNIVAVVGLCGAGKSEATQIFIKNGYERVYFGDATFEELKRQNLEITPENERKIREELRAKGDMTIYAKLSENKIKKYFEAGKNVVIESMYSWSEYKYIKEIYGDNFKVLAIVVDKEKRVERLSKRPFRPLTPQEVLKRDYTEIENIEKGGPIAIADHFVSNNGSLADLEKDVQDYINSLK